MRVAFVGKGGSGKTTLAALFARHLAAQGAPVVAIDADINQHLGAALGLTEDQSARVPPLGGQLTEIKEYLRGDNPRIASGQTMVKTTPAGRGSRLVRLGGHDPFHRDWSIDADGVRLMATGPFTEEDLGVACYHSKTGAVELYLNHLVDGTGEYVVVDMTAGADSFASGLFGRGVPTRAHRRGPAGVSEHVALRARRRAGPVRPAVRTGTGQPLRSGAAAKRR